MPVHSNPSRLTTLIDLTVEDDEVDEETQPSSFGYLLQPNEHDEQVARQPLHGTEPPSRPQDEGFAFPMRNVARPRGPRYSRDDIIDLSADSSSPEMHATPRRPSPEERRTTWDASRRPPTLLRDPSSDIAVVGERQHTRSHRFRAEHDAFSSMSPSPQRRRNLQSRTVDTRSGQPLDPTSDDDIVYVETRPANIETEAEGDTSVIFVGETRREPARQAGVYAALANTTHSFMQAFNAAFAGPRPQESYYAQIRRQTAAFLGPGQLNYGQAGFAMGLDHSSSNDQQRPTPKYEPPRPAASGFTRSPKEGEEVVCPACGDELTRGETDEKKQVWIVKNCGHVYCGECINNRKKPTKGKAKAREHDPHLHFSECVVDGCQAKVAAKTSVVQLFL